MPLLRRRCDASKPNQPPGPNPNSTPRRRWRARRSRSTWRRGCCCRWTVWCGSCAQPAPRASPSSRRAPASGALPGMPAARLPCAWLPPAPPLRAAWYGNMNTACLCVQASIRRVYLDKFRNKDQSGVGARSLAGVCSTEGDGARAWHAPPCSLHSLPSCSCSYPPARAPAGFAKFGIHRIEVLDTLGVLGPGPGIDAGACCWRLSAAHDTATPARPRNIPPTTAALHPPTRVSAHAARHAVPMLCATLRLPPQASSCLCGTPTRPGSATTCCAWWPRWGCPHRRAQGLRAAPQRAPPPPPPPHAHACPRPSKLNARAVPSLPLPPLEPKSPPGPSSLPQTHVVYDHLDLVLHPIAFHLTEGLAVSFWVGGCPARVPCGRQRTPLPAVPAPATHTPQPHPHTHHRSTSSRERTRARPAPQPPLRGQWRCPPRPPQSTAAPPPRCRPARAAAQICRRRRIRGRPCW